MNGTAKYFSLDNLTEHEGRVLTNYVVEEGKIEEGYGKEICIRKTTANVDLCFYADLDQEDNKKMYAKGLHFHCSSLDVWKMKILAKMLDNDSDSYNFRRLLVTRPDGDGLLVVNLINADVLPSFVPGTEFQAQVIAFPYDFKYFETEKDYEEAVDENLSGRHLYHADGFVLPAAFLMNHGIESEALEDKAPDDLTVIKGTVKKVQKNTLEIENEHTFYHVTIGTMWGDIQVVHSINHIEENQIELIEEGSIVYGNFWIQGDPAILKYENYALNADNNLRLLQHIFVYGESDRLKKALADNAVFETISSEMIYEGKDDIIARLKYVSDNCKDECYAHIARITDIKDSSDTLHPIGTNCIVLAYGDKEDYASIAFLQTNEDGLITKIEITDDDRYQFEIDISLADG